MFGDQTDVPESGDWWDAGYLIMWGSNVPVTRTPDAHWMTEARYRGQKVIAVSPDYADNVKFADEWLAVRPGTDAALAMAMGHVILKEFFVDSQTPYFERYVASYTDLPHLVRIDEAGDGAVPGKFLTAADLSAHADVENADFKTVVLDARTGEPVVPNGSLGHRFGSDDEGRWNLDLDGVEPMMRLGGADEETVELRLPVFDPLDGTPAEVVRAVPVRRVDGQLVTTVYELMLRALRRAGADYADAEAPYTPAWQEPITGVPAQPATRIAREFAANARDSRGRSMILMGAGTNHWFHSDTIYRSFLALTTLTGCQGVNGGGWAHYVGQEKVRPITGYTQVANALDWSRPPRNMIQTAYWYLHTDQFRYDHFGADALSSATGQGRFAGLTAADLIAKSARMGWMPSYPTFDRNPLDLCDEAAAAGVPGRRPRRRRAQGRAASASPARTRTRRRTSRASSASGGPTSWAPPARATSTSSSTCSAPTPRCAPPRHPKGVDLPTSPGSTRHPRASSTFSTPWTSGRPAPRSSPTSSSRRPPGTRSTTCRAPTCTLSCTPSTPRSRLRGSRARTGTRSATWHTSSPSSPGHGSAFGATSSRPRSPTTPPTRWPTRTGRSPTGRPASASRSPAAPCRSWWRLSATTAPSGRSTTRSGPLMDTLGATTKGVTFDLGQAVGRLGDVNGEIRGGVGDGRPSLREARQVCEAILTMSGTTNGHLAVEGFKALERRTGQRLHDLAAEHEGKQITFADTQAAPQPVITSPEWSGSETGGRRYSAFTINVERLKPWHTLTGRQSFYLDHDWMTEVGEALPVYRPPLNMAALFSEPDGR